MRDPAKITQGNGVTYCAVCGFYITPSGLCHSKCPTASKRPSARAEPQPRTWSYEEIRAAFERDREEL